MNRWSQAILLVAFIVAPGWCQTQENCLWLNAATAGGVLEGTATVSVSWPEGSSTNAHPANAKSSAGPMSANSAATSYSKNGIDDADCVFVRRAGAIVSQMRIEVRTMSESRSEFAAHMARCGPRSAPLKAIGNEAQACSLASKAAQHTEQVVGRVRDRSFLVRITTNNASIGQPELREKARLTAEQVAGNLF